MQAKWLCVAVWLLWFGSITSMAEPEDPDSPEATVRAFMDRYDPRCSNLPDLYSVCDRFAERALPALVPYLDQGGYDRRCLAFSILFQRDRTKRGEYVLIGLEQPLDVAIKAARYVVWSEEPPEAFNRVRALLHRWCRDETADPSLSRQAALTLGVIGLSEDRAALREGLTKVQTGRIVLVDVQIALQDEWERTREGIPPREALELDYRAALAKLGDPDEIPVFLDRLLGSDLERVRDALVRAQYIARPELTAGVARWLGSREGAHQGSCGNPPLAGMANHALRATYPDLAASIPVGTDLEFWEKWTSELGESRVSPSGSSSGPASLGDESGISAASSAN